MASKDTTATAILTQKKAPNKLTVEDSKNDDNTIIEITEKKMEELKLMRGD
jgi:transitional endoplasmic reticulum ATPase